MSPKSSYAYTGSPANRVDGAAKVTGSARYAAEFEGPELLHGHVVSSSIARGKILSVDITEAENVPGIVKVFTHENTPHFAWLDRSYRDQVAPDGSPLRPLHDRQILFHGQPIALVVAHSPERATYAASLVSVTYEEDRHATDLAGERANAYMAPASRSGIELPPKPRGNPDEVYHAAGLTLKEDYTTPVQHHNPMELFATTAIWDGDVLTVHDKTQGVLNTQAYLTKVFGLSKKQLQVRSPFVGGAFGSALRPQFQCFMAVLAALELKRNVRVTLTRQQMFSLSGRSRTIQRVQLGATLYGDLKAVIHECFSETSRFEDYIENIVNWSGILYRCENVRQKYDLAKLDINTPCDMRAPGATQGVFAFECAIDELAAALNDDPLEFRIRHHTERDQAKDLPYSSKQLLECYRRGAAAFGWEKRDPAARSTPKGRLLIGSGMATGVWEAMQMPASAKAVLSADGTLEVSSATSDIGTGTYTIMTQLAAEVLGLNLHDVTFKLGDTSLPSSPLQGGSWTAASVGSAVRAVCLKVRSNLLKLALAHDVFTGLHEEHLTLEEGFVRSIEKPSRRLSIASVMEASQTTSIERKTMSLPKMLKQRKYTKQSHSAVFAEVAVDVDTGMVRVTRVVSAIAGGRILNPKTARSQILGGVVWGIGMALQEETIFDHRLGRIINHSLADYHFPVHADLGEIAVIFVPEEDEIVNPLGVKGLGEIGIVGVAAAVANAVYHATGKRVRDLPITPDKLL
ncbi:MAG: xanthine dehydrogenase family protein molybdopterin-binding subunit [Verrucomicrobiaceae bacterium]|nr:MAG: xanthine dehydrogenase family protein molybdopterin-binding subunit [Verrucomicrobiaceae bacterium]